MISRRGFITILATLIAPLAIAQPPGKVYRIGRLGLSNPVAARDSLDAW